MARSKKDRYPSKAVLITLLGVIMALVFTIGLIIGIHVGAQSRPDRRYTPYFINPRYPSPTPASR